MRNLEHLNVKDFVAILLRRIWYLLVTCILVTAGGLFYVWHLPSIYKSETTIVIAGRIVPEDYIRSIDRGTTNDRIDFVKQQIQSRTFLARIVQEFQLAPTDAAATDEAVNSLRNRIDIPILSPNRFKLSVVD